MKKAIAVISIFCLLFSIASEAGVWIAGKQLILFSPAAAIDNATCEDSCETACPDDFGPEKPLCVAISIPDDSENTNCCGSVSENPPPRKACLILPSECTQKQLIGILIDPANPLCCCICIASPQSFECTDSRTKIPKPLPIHESLIYRKNKHQTETIIFPGNSHISIHASIAITIFRC